jgi:23S rRNA (guanosine2251-2'-O)-methyltransferase
MTSFKYKTNNFMPYENRRASESERNELLFGIRAIIEAVKSGKEIDKLFLQAGIKGELISELKAIVAAHQIPYQYVPIEKLNRLTPKNHQGAVCFVSPIAYQHIETILPGIYEKGEVPLILILDRITDIRNFGAIARTAECAGVHALIIPSRGAAQINGDAIKTSAGALHKIPVCKEENLKATIEFLKDSGVQIIACSEKTDKDYYTADMTGPVALIMGSEEDGISAEYLKRCDATVKIPLYGTIDSLNVGVATGIVLFEGMRQRLKAK